MKYEVAGEALAILVITRCQSEKPSADNKRCQRAPALISSQEEPISTPAAIPLQHPSDYTHDVTMSSLHTLVAVHLHPLGVSAELPIRRWADRPAACVTCAGLLQSHKLFGTESLVVNLAGRFDKILQVGSGEEVTERDELAVVLVLDIDDAPAVLSAAYLPSIDDDILFRANYGKGNQIFDGRVELALLLVVFVVVVWEHAQIMELELLPDALFESNALLERKRIRFGDDWYDIDHVGEFLQNHDVDGLQAGLGQSSTYMRYSAEHVRVARRLNEEKTAMDPGILDVALALRSEFLA